MVDQPGFFLAGQNRDTSCSNSFNMEFSQDKIPQCLHWYIKQNGCPSDRDIVLHDTFICIR
ncbi:hypothetical protein DPMN_052328 [Dreissena polymorpha]|uniref:Uncharacterized protein n=1 Tax=Dreissena polymorpha TaxID=45954 RepID=A0A9D4HPQ5_DREPO|nr:hypothetical protein DPMN_052328 [Dreissena polymorpha]